MGVRFDFLKTDSIHVDSAVIFIQKIQKGRIQFYERARLFLIKGSEDLRRERNFKVGDQVWLETKYLKEKYHLRS